MDSEFAPKIAHNNNKIAYNKGPLIHTNPNIGVESRFPFIPNPEIERIPVSAKVDTMISLIYLCSGSRITTKNIIRI
jgi:hypothetical protein